jgi:hypothetical protein
MTKPTHKKTTAPSSLAAKAKQKKGQSTLQTAWDKKADMTGSSRTQTPNAAPDTPTVPMTENTPSATDATDTTMRVPPEPRSPPSPDKRESTLSKRLKADSDVVPSESSPSTASPSLTDTDNTVLPDLSTPATKNDPLAQQVTPPTDPIAPPTNSSLPVSPPSSKLRGRPPPNSPQLLSNNAVTPSARASTPPRSNRTTPADTRFELRLTVPASSPDDALKVMTDTISKILAKIWESDKKAQVVPWYNDSKAPHLKRLEDIPNTISAIRQYFPRLAPNAKGGTKFSSIRLRLSIPAATLKEDIDWYLRDNKHGLYIAQIQAETVDTILWLLWSHDMIDTDALRLSMEAHVAHATKVKISIGLRWRIIQLDQPGRIPDDEAVKALHIDVAREHRTIAKQALEAIYSSTQTHWPLHIRMRAVPLLKDVMNGQVKKDIHRLIGRQASFNDEELGKRRINTWEIKELDFLSPDDYTLRDYIMSIRHPTDPKKSLFHSVDHLRFNRSTVVFTCMPSVEAEARNMVSCLLTVLNHLFGDVVNEFFTKDAQLRAAGSYWDEDEQCVRNEDDAHVASLADIDEDYHLPPVHKKGKSAEQTAPPRPEPTAMSLQRNTFGEEEDSIGTFRREQANLDTISISSTIVSDSTESIASLTSRLSALEKLLTTHNIALPAAISASDSTEMPPQDRESGNN